MTWAVSVCASGYYLSTTSGLCAPCTPTAGAPNTPLAGVETCNKDNALTCSENYVFNAVTKVCSVCDATDNASTKTCSPSSSYAAGCSSGF